MSSKTPQGMSSKTPQGMSSKTPQGAPSKTPQGAPSKTPQGVPSKTPQGVPSALRVLWYIAWHVLWYIAWHVLWYVAWRGFNLSERVGLTSERSERVRKDYSNNIYTQDKMIKFNAEIVIVIILVFGVYYLYEQNMYLKSKILQCTDAERDTKETLDYINKDLLNIKRTLQEGQQGTGHSTQRRPRVSFQEPPTVPTVVPVVTVTPPTEEMSSGLSELNERVVGDSLRNLGNILGRLPRGTVSRSSFSMNVPSSMLNSLNRGGGDIENEKDDDQSLDLEQEPTPTKTI